MIRPRAVTPPPSRWKLPALFSASLLLVAVTGTFTYAKFRNDAARSRVEAACDLIRRDEQARNAAMESAAKLVTGRADADKIASIEKATRVSRVCDPLRAELSGYRWNFGRHWSPPLSTPARCRAARRSPPSARGHDRAASRRWGCFSS